MRRALLLWFTVLSAAASAAEVHVGADQIRYTGDAGRNSVTVAYGRNDVTISDRRQALTAGPGCAQVDAGSATCPAGAVRLDLGGSRDIANVTCDAERGLCGSVAMYGGPGSDSLDAVERRGVLDGGPGDDSLGGWGGGVLRGGPGDDLIRWYGSWPRVDCGAGDDEFWPHFPAHVSSDCEQFRDVLGTHAPTRMRIVGDRLVLTSFFVPECPLEWRFHAPKVVSQRIGYGRVRAAVPLPDGIRAPFLHARVACGEERSFPTLFRLVPPPRP